MSTWPTWEPNQKVSLKVSSHSVFIPNLPAVWLATEISQLPLEQQRILAMILSVWLTLQRSVHFP